MKEVRKLEWGGRLNNEAAGTQPEASRIFPCYPNNNGSQFQYSPSLHTVFCLINYPTDGIIKLEFEAMIKAALF